MSVPILPGRPNHQVEQLAAVNLRLTGHGRADARFDDQVAALAQARDEGLIGGIGHSNVSLEQLRHAAHGTDVVACSGTASIAHLRENLAAEAVRLDHEALQDLDGVGA